MLSVHAFSGHSGRIIAHSQLLQAVLYYLRYVTQFCINTKNWF